MTKLTATIAILSAVLLLGAAAGPAAAAAPPAAFTQIEGHYEAVRAALAADTVAGIKAHAEAIAARAAGLGGAETGVAAADAASCQKVMDRIAAAARKLAAATDLAAARTAFGELSEPMVSYRNMVPGDRPMVVYCPMAKKDWLQPDGPIANPYYGKKMLRCGEIVSK